MYMHLLISVDMGGSCYVSAIFLYIGLVLEVAVFFFFLMIRRPLESPLFPSRRRSGFIREGAYLKFKALDVGLIREKGFLERRGVN